MEAHPCHSTNQLRAVVIGATGYSGAELVGLLASHPGVDIVGLFASADTAASHPKLLGDLVPRLKGVCDQPVQPASIDAILDSNPDAVFLAATPEVSMSLVPPLHAAGIVVLDLSAAHRLRNAALYDRFYGVSHPSPGLLSEAAYGLAEWERDSIAHASLIAVPGCYPTGVALGLLPLQRSGLLKAQETLIADCTSGVSGAGKASSARTHFCNVSLQPYGVLSHRHTPEIEQTLGRGVIFTPHLGPFARGILSTLHARLAPDATADDVHAAFHSAYAHEPLIRLRDTSQWPSVGDVERTCYCDIAWAIEPSLGHIIIVTAIDNLLKGAAGQAVQCMNIRFGFPETLGIGSARTKAVML